MENEAMKMNKKIDAYFILIYDEYNEFKIFRIQE